MVEEIDAARFQADVLGSEGMVLVDFSATWCGPCRMLRPVLEEISAENEGRVTIYSVDIDRCRNLALQYGVSAVPTMILFQDGKPVRQAMGAQPKANVLDLLGL